MTTVHVGTLIMHHSINFSTLVTKICMHVGPQFASPLSTFHNLVSDTNFLPGENEESQILHSLGSIPVFFLRYWYSA